MSHDLQDLMHRTVRDTAEPDAGRLAHDARRRGLAIRRRRQALGLTGAAAAAALVLGGTQLVAGTTTSGSPTGDAAAGTPAATTRALDTVPATGRTTAAALAAVLDGVDAGEATRAGGLEDSSGTYAEVWWRAPDDSGTSVVSVDVLPGFDRPGALDCEHQVFDDECSSETRPDGYRRTSFQLVDRSGSQAVTRRVVDVLRADGTRVVASTSNGRTLGNGVAVQTQTRSSLTYDQLRTIAEDPAFGARMSSAWAGPREPSTYAQLAEPDLQGWVALELVRTDCRSCSSSDWTSVGPPLSAPTTDVERRHSLRELKRVIQARAAELRAEEPAPTSAQADPER